MAVVAVVCIVILVTTGQAAASEQRILARIDAVGTRLLTVIDDSGTAGISAAGVTRLGALSDVEWAIGLGPAIDMSSTALFASSTGVPARALVGDLPSIVRIVEGRAPLPGEAVLGQDAAASLSIGAGGGALAPTELLTTGSLVPHDSRQVPVVGVFAAASPLDTLDRVALVAAGGENAPEARFVHVLARDFGVVERLGTVLRNSIEAKDPARVTVDVPQGAVDLRAVVAGDLGRSGRATMLVVLAVGVILVAVTTLGAVTARRREFGRRRALGASRSMIIALVLVQCGVCALVGATVGTTAGLTALWFGVGMLPAPGFTLGSVTLVVLVVLLGAVPPAVAAAWRDPMRILRVP